MSVLQHVVHDSSVQTLTFTDSSGSTIDVPLVSQLSYEGKIVIEGVKQWIDFSEDLSGAKLMPLVDTHMMHKGFPLNPDGWEREVDAVLMYQLKLSVMIDTFAYSEQTVRLAEYFARKRYTT